MGEIPWVFYSCGTLKELIQSLNQELICQEIQIGKQENSEIFTGTSNVLFFTIFSYSPKHLAVKT